MTVGDARAALKPLAFVAMPFGRKPDPTGRFEIDFDDIYERAIRPAGELAGVDVVRADEERVGGFIHVPMFERLLLAEIVVADLTLSSPNVFYELGIRHAARPKSTVLLFAKIGQLAFDVAPMRALPYYLTDGRLRKRHAKELRNALAERLELALGTDYEDDSPLFQLFTDYPGITLSHEVTQSFQKRARLLAELTQRIRDLTRRQDRQAALEELRALSGEIAPSTSPPDLVVELLLAYRDLEAWDAMIGLIEQLPPKMRRGAPIREQLGLALGRRGHAGDNDAAVRVLRDLLDEEGESPETYGILGGVYKRRWRQLLDEDSAAAEAALDAAIEAYVAGFLTDPRDFYPGVNAVSLLVAKATPEAIDRAQDLVQAVTFAVGRRGGLESNDYWQVATVLELSVIAEDERQAERAAARARLVSSQPWMRDTTASNLEDLERQLARAGRDVVWVRPLAARLREPTAIP